ncbi:MAG: tRNA (adenosine(37)-N6)-threonylcarbamoyltransferase complex dimerization subunit type 1 TsaB [bacterium]|nr:tRNA (adenosine(37)-N6)-threonylcarbamoyltransferase complex dimerization subunit type 1 TsaB [bacterium]
MYLGINLATETQSIGLASEKHILSELSIHRSYEFSENLIHKIDAMLKDFHSQSSYPLSNKKLENNNYLKTLSGIGITTGPGNYTSLKTGVTSAKTLGQTLSIPVYPVSTLKALVYNYRHINGIFFSLIPATQKDMSCAVFACNNGIISRVTPDFTWDKKIMLDKISEIKGTIYVTGVIPEDMLHDLNISSTATVFTSEIAGSTIAAMACRYKDKKIPYEDIHPVYSHQPNIKKRRGA